MRTENDMDPKEILQSLKTKHSDRPIIAELNINFLDPKFEPLKDIIKDKVDKNMIPGQEKPTKFLISLHSKGKSP